MYSLTTHGRLAARRSASLAETLANAWRRFQHWRELANERRLLLSMDERSLHDLGLSRADAEREAAKIWPRY